MSYGVLLEQGLFSFLFYKRERLKIWHIALQTHMCNGLYWLKHHEGNSALLHLHKSYARQYGPFLLRVDVVEKSSDPDPCCDHRKACISFPHTRRLSVIKVEIKGGCSSCRLFTNDWEPGFYVYECWREGIRCWGSVVRKREAVQNVLPRFLYCRQLINWASCKK